MKGHLLDNFAHLILFLEEYFFMFPQRDDPITLDDSGDTYAFRKNSRLLLKFLHRSKKNVRKLVRNRPSDIPYNNNGDFESIGGNNISTPSQEMFDSNQDKIIEEIGVWKDFDLCQHLVETMEPLLKEPFLDVFWSCDTSSFFGPKSGSIFHVLLRMLLVFLGEGEIFYDRASLRY
jgi:hypothetical protein